MVMQFVVDRGRLQCNSDGPGSSGKSALGMPNRPAPPAAAFSGNFT
jgi:hypothetical protein